MVNTKLIIITGMSGSGKSTTAQRLAQQFQLNGVRHRWLHEEIAHHPIRDGEFSLGSLYDHADVERNIQDMFERWDRLVARIVRSSRVHILEGVLYDNIIRYFFTGNYPADKVIAYYDTLMQHLAPARPLVVFLYRSNVRATLEGLYPLRGAWWKDLIMDASRERYFTDQGLTGEEGVYAMWQAYQDLSDAAFQRCPNPKIKIDTLDGDWDSYMQRLAQCVGLEYRKPPATTVADPARFCGQFAADIDGRLHTLDIRMDEAGLYCKAFWPYMKLLPLGGNRFTFSSFPIRLTFMEDEAGRVQAVRVRGTYDWEIMGQTLTRQLPSASA